VKRILVLGATGMLGHRVIRELATRHEVIAHGRREPEPVDGVRVVIGDLRSDSLDPLLDELRPDVIVNGAGAIKQRLDEWSRRDVLLVNTLLPHALAAWCQANDRRLIHVSTDCVFRGDRSGPPYRETDPPDVMDLYGYSKAAGEVAHLPTALTLRTSIIGREIGTRFGLLEWFLSQPRDASVSGFDNHWWSGVTTVELARLIGRIVDEHASLSGLHQVAGEPISKYELLRMANRLFGAGVSIRRVTTDAPIYRVLDGSRLRDAIGYTPTRLETQLEWLCSQEHTY
jgi:dTDP-4-dehydrorhamnose reductase